MGHGGIEHGGDETALYHVSGMTEIGAHIEFHGAGGVQRVHCDNLAAEHLDETGRAGVHLIEEFLVFHWAIFPALVYRLKMSG
jgi:hypothetical protein